jgi:hypothetical protein
MVKTNLVSEPPINSISLVAIFLASWAEATKGRNTTKAKHNMGTNDFIKYFFI